MARFIEVTALVRISSWDPETRMEVSDMESERVLVNVDAILFISDRGDRSRITFQSGGADDLECLTVLDGYKYLARKLIEGEQG